jgi:hypothetical protein
VVNERYTDPVAFLAQGRSPRADPLETSPSMVELVNPTESAARREILHGARTTDLSATDVEDLVIAVSEAITRRSATGPHPLGCGWGPPLVAGNPHSGC